VRALEGAAQTVDALEDAVKLVGTAPTSVGCWAGILQA
jgi:hypothetical protein